MRVAQLSISAVPNMCANQQHEKTRKVYKIIKFCVRTQICISFCKPHCYNSESASSSETESIADNDELPMQEQLSDIDVYEDETEDDGNNKDQDPNDDEASSEDEDQVAITAGNATYYDTAFPSRLRRQNILTQQQ